MENTVTGVASLFVITVILTWIGSEVLGSVGFKDCTSMNDYNADATKTRSWAQLCQNANQTTLIGFSMLSVVLAIPVSGVIWVLYKIII